jgi:hypothetical protein
MTKRAAFTQSDVHRVLKGARSAGMPLDEMVVEVDFATGRMTMRPAAPSLSDTSSENPWDEVLRK